MLNAVLPSGKAQHFDCCIRWFESSYRSKGDEDMKKIPTLFKRVFVNNEIVKITPEVTEGCEGILEGKGIATVKWDGACCAIINGELYKRYDAKKGKQPPEGAIPCQPEADPVTGHFPHWVKCNRDNPADKWFFDAYDETSKTYYLSDWTYEAIGKSFQGNPYSMDCNEIVPHGGDFIHDIDRSFDGIREYLKNNYIEGIVFWENEEPICKIKRTDFGFEWKGGKK